MTGHAHHFLRRLDRLSTANVKLALSLYNDVPMLQFILGEAKVPEGVERTAICLGPPERGPHVIVSRAGRFITALGEGMKPFLASASTSRCRAGRPRSPKRSSRQGERTASSVP